jgi:DMSO/TMAO reductase YedYZ molybdopterin-dependent catalytic subunit
MGLDSDQRRVRSTIVLGDAHMDHPKFTRRRFIQSAGLFGLAGLAGPRPAAADTVTLPFENGTRQLVQYPQKRPLIVLTSRALQLETPLSHFDFENIDAPITPNDSFFVRYHNAKMPTTIDAAKFRVSVTGLVDKPLSLSVDDLKTKFTPIEVVAVNSCTGNSRGFNNPRVPGGQWAHGAMGNARWTGVSLKDVLAMAGVQAGAVQVTFNGLDQGVKKTVPDFVKSMNLDVATNGEVMLAYAMNGADLPFLNGFPVRLVAPGYTGTYWVKHLSEINVINSVFTEFYMGTAYREPDNACACETPDALAPTTRPVTRPRLRSLITNLTEGAMVQTGVAMLARGIAFDGGSGIKNVMFSADGGATWSEATLGRNLGNYSFRGWQATFTLPAAGAYALKVKAIANSGETQPEVQYWQRTGYGYNPIETVNVTAI